MKYFNSDTELYLRMVANAVKYVRNTQKRIPNYSNIHLAMEKLNTEYMYGKNLAFSKKCITLAVSFGFLEMMGDGYISVPVILPKILAVCSKQNIVSYAVDNSGKKYFLMSDLSKYMCEMHPQYSHNFTCKCLYNVIVSTAKYFRVLQSDIDRGGSINYRNIHFRLRSHAMKLYHTPKEKK